MYVSNRSPPITLDYHHLEDSLEELEEQVEVETIDEKVVAILSSDLMATTSSHLQVIVQYNNFFDAFK